jgi:hypothetical protein
VVSETRSVSDDSSEDPVFRDDETVEPSRTTVLVLRPAVLVLENQRFSGPRESEALSNDFISLAEREVGDADLRKRGGFAATRPAPSSPARRGLWRPSELNTAA